MHRTDVSWLSDHSVFVFRPCSTSLKAAGTLSRRSNTAQHCSQVWDLFWTLLGFVVARSSHAKGAQHFSQVLSSEAMSKRTNDPVPGRAGTAEENALRAVSKAF